MWTWSSQCIFTFYSIKVCFYNLKIVFLTVWVSLTFPAQGGEACASLMRRTSHLKRRTPHLRRRTPHLRRCTPPRWGSRLLACKVWFRLSFLYINGIFWFIFCILFCLRHVSWCTCMVYIYVINMILVVYCIYLCFKWIFDVKLLFYPLHV